MARQIGLFYLIAFAAVTNVIAAEPMEGATSMAVLEYRDSDQDGIPDYLDACPGSRNIADDDSDGDLVTDSCDLDPVGKGIFSR